WWAHALRGGPRGPLPARRILRRQNPQGNETRRSSSGAADKVRVGYQSESRQADRRDDSAVATVPGGQGNQMKREASEKRRMKRKSTVLPLCAMLLALCLPAEAQQTKKVARIGYLSALDPVSESTRVEGIRSALRERGYIEGQNIAIEYRYAEGKRD